MRPVSIQSLLAIGACLTFAPLSWAQAGGEAVVEYLTLDNLVAQVLEENPGFLAAQAAARSANYRIEPAGALRDPMLSYSIAPLSSDQSIDVSQKIPWPGTLHAREAVARHEAAAADWNVSTERLKLTAAAKSAYAEWYFVARALDVHHDVQGLLAELIETAEGRYAAGLASRQDVLQARVERTELEARELRLRHQRTAARARINALLNRAPDAPLPPAAPIKADASVPDVRALERLAIERHPALERLAEEIAAATGRVTLAHKAFYPNFRIHAGYNALWDDPDQRPMVGVSINIPFGRGKREAELDHAQAELRRAEWSRKDRRAELLADLARARAAVVESIQTIQLYEQRFVPLARQYLDAAIADYRSGTGAFLSVVTAEQRSLETELALERARADYLRRLAELELWAGGGLNTAAGLQGEDQ